MQTVGVGDVLIMQPYMTASRIALRYHFIIALKLTSSPQQTLTVTHGHC